jgi:competence protein ComQ
MVNRYKKGAIVDCIQTFIEEYVTEPYLKDSALRSLVYKAEEFIFSKLTYIHLLIWAKEENVENQIKLMSSVELFVLACDILDDLQDQDTEKEPWMKIETKYAMDLVFLFLELGGMMLERTSYPSETKLELLDIYCLTKLKSVNGQNQSLQKKMMNEEDYISMIEKKSGSFMEFACLMGAVYASKEEKQKILQYAIHIGCSAQIENDLLGISEKQQFKDIFMKEISLPIIYLLQYSHEQFVPLREYYENKLTREEFLDYTPRLNELVVQSGAIVYTRSMQSIQLQRAFTIMERLYKNQDHINLIKDIVLNR